MFELCSNEVCAPLIDRAAADLAEVVKGLLETRKTELAEESSGDALLDLAHVLACVSARTVEKLSNGPPPEAIHMSSMFIHAMLDSMLGRMVGNAEKSAKERVEAHESDTCDSTNH